MEDSYVVYNNLIDDQYNALIIDVKPTSLAIIQSTIEWHWRTLQHVIAPENEASH